MLDVQNDDPEVLAGKHATQAFAPVSHAGSDAPQSVLMAHPQVSVAARQAWPVVSAAQSVWPCRHSSHLSWKPPAPVSQCGVAGVAEQFVSAVHATQLSVVRSHAGVAPLQPPGFVTQTWQVLSSDPLAFTSHLKAPAHWMSIMHDELHALFVHEKFGVQLVVAPMMHDPLALHLSCACWLVVVGHDGPGPQFEFTGLKPHASAPSQRPVLQSMPLVAHAFFGSVFTAMFPQVPSWPEPFSVPRHD